MAQWVVVTTALKIAVGLVVDNVVERRELGDGRVRWLVDGPQCGPELIWLVPGVLSVDPAESPASLARSAT